MQNTPVQQSSDRRVITGDGSKLIKYIYTDHIVEKKSETKIQSAATAIKNKLWVPNDKQSIYRTQLLLKTITLFQRKVYFDFYSPKWTGHLGWHDAWLTFCNYTSKQKLLFSFTKRDCFVSSPVTLIQLD